MALLTKGEFAARCGIPSKDLSNYIKRGKVLLGDDGMINDQIEQNSAFIAKRISMQGQDPTPADVSPNYAKPARARSATRSKPKDGKDAETMYDIDKRRRELDIETKTRQLELQDMEIAKRMGRLIPVDNVRIIFAAHSKSITQAISQMLENHLVEIAKRAHFTAEEMAATRKSMTDKLNEAIDRAVDNSKRSVAAVVDEYATVRSTR